MELNAKGLDDADRAILAFECGWWTEPGLKTTRIRNDLGISSASYYKRLSELIISAEALEVDPLLIRRLRKRRLFDERLDTSANERPSR
ncbi:MAG TPA: DUF3263 domain-containing protein [Acidimicrobiales bacterium]|nr:DUF3263 domain-containing protein [Acidimicrobiales bacterium]